MKASPAAPQCCDTARRPRLRPVAWDVLSEEQRELRELVRTVARERIAPRAAEIDASHEFPWDVVELFRDQGIFGLFFARGGRRHRYGNAAFARRDRGGLEGLRHERADPRGAGARLARAQARRLGRAARGLAAATRVGRGARRVRADRGGLGLRLRRDAHRCATRQRGVRARRDEAVHHERRCRGSLHGVREDRSRCGTCGDLGVPRRAG